MQYREYVSDLIKIAFASHHDSFMFCLMRYLDPYIDHSVYKIK